MMDELKLRLRKLRRHESIRQSVINLKSVIESKSRIEEIQFRFDFNLLNFKINE